MVIKYGNILIGQLFNYDMVQPLQAELCISKNKFTILCYTEFALFANQRERERERAIE